VDGLEDVKAQDIAVFNTEHLSALFERVMIASGTSNRQTRALASSVRDAVRDAGFAKPRIEGEENGEWIIVDCGAAVVHIMQPAIRQYYHLEELWGDKPIKLKLGAAKPEVAIIVKTTPALKKPAARPARSSAQSKSTAPVGKAKPKPARKAVASSKALAAKRPLAGKGKPKPGLALGTKPAIKKVVAKKAA
jgi:ribosome-associated protein